jgi:pyruvate/2-oxoglutarate dehydrogenase complex dihydrolipoamide dehydrogenase (E3) component
MLEYLRAEGITIFRNTNLIEVTDLTPNRVGNGNRLAPTLGNYRVVLDMRGEKRELTVDQILIATGRKPNVEGLGLESIGVRIGKSGIEVNAKLQTAVKNIYAAGDVVGHYLFTHVAAFQAHQIIRNIFFPGSNSIDYSVVPWTTFCDPEVARCGLTEAEARRTHGDVDVFTVDFRNVDRAIAEGETEGLIKIVATKWTGKILGVHLIGARAGEILHEFVLAMKVGIPMRKLASLIHVYPTFSSIVWQVAGKWLAEGTLLKTVRRFLRKGEK